MFDKGAFYIRSFVQPGTVLRYAKFDNRVRRGHMYTADSLLYTLDEMHVTLVDAVRPQACVPVLEYTKASYIRAWGGMRFATHGKPCATPSVQFGHGEFVYWSFGEAVDVRYHVPLVSCDRTVSWCSLVPNPVPLVHLV